jgi:hypothetical protein
MILVGWGRTLSVKLDCCSFREVSRKWSLFQASAVKEWIDVFGPRELRVNRSPTADVYVSTSPPVRTASEGAAER